MAYSISMGGTSSGGYMIGRHRMRGRERAR
jgi:hypothetical protein